jgi:hypothetical protein
LNIRKTDIVWQGKIVGNDPEFETFSAPEYGIRAAAKILQNYQEKHQITTLREVINRWAPPSENDTSAYVQAVSIWSDYEPDDPLDLNHYETTYRLLRAMTRMENGKPPEPKTMWYPDDLWEKGLRQAGLSPSKPLTKSRTAVATAGGAVASTSAVAVLTDLLGLPAWIEPMIPQALSGLDEKQVAIGILILVGLTQWRTIFARVDDKLKGRL